MIAFSSSVDQWQPDLQSVSEDSVSDALQWLSGLKADGSSYLLQALRVSRLKLALQVVWCYLCV